MQQLLATEYREREVHMGHRDLIPSMKPIVGGVKLSSILGVTLNVALSALVLVGDEFDETDLTTATLFEDADGKLWRVPEPTWFELRNFASYVLQPASTSLTRVVKASISLELEHRAAGAST
eukprot:1579723-Prymnesium_polylepis.1